MTLEPLFLGVYGYGYRSGFWNIRYTETPNENIAFIGSATDASGMFHEDYTACSSYARDIHVKIDGVDVAVSILSSDDNLALPTLSAGEVRYYWVAGKLEFSTADYGKSLEFYTDVCHYPGG